MSKATEKFKIYELLLILILAVYSIYKFYPAFQNGFSVAYPYGDGLGTMSWFGEISEQVKVHGPSYMISDVTPVEKIGDGVFAPVPTNFLQKSIVVALSQFLSPDNIYDVYAMLGFFLVGLATYYLLRELGVYWALSFVAAIVVMNNDNDIRYTGHLTLATSFMPIILTLCIVRFAKSLSFFRALGLVLATVLNFMMNEYYGYYGVFYAIFLLIGLLVYFNYGRLKQRLFWKQLFGYSIFAFIMFVLLMSFAYPTLFFDKLVNVFTQHSSSLSNYGSRSYADFLAYSVVNHWYFFFPKLIFLQALLPSSFFLHGTFWEQSFRLGLIMPFIFLLSYIFILSQRNKLNGAERWKLLFIFALLPAIFVIFLFTNNPQNGISLVHVSYEISKVFRVSSRAYIYIYILSVVVFFFYLNFAYNILHRRIMDQQLAFSLRLQSLSLNAFVVIIGFLTLYDATGSFWKESFKVYKLPNDPIYSALEKLPDGLVCELPMYSLPDDTPEIGYPYNYNRSRYKKYLLNAEVPVDNKFYSALNSLKFITKHPNKKVIGYLRRLGVRYVVVNSSNAEWGQGALKDQITLLDQSDKKRLYQINDFRRMPPSEARKQLLLATDGLRTLANHINEQLLYKRAYERVSSMTALKIGSVVDFSTEESRKFIVSGLSYRENWGTWTNAKKAILIFRVEKNEFHSVKFLVLKMNIFTDGKYIQNAVFKLNGKIVAQRNFRVARKSIVEIPVSGLLKQGNILTLEMPKAVSPEDLGVSGDPRKLSLGLITMELKS